MQSFILTDSEIECSACIFAYFFYWNQVKIPAMFNRRDTKILTRDAYSMCKIMKEVKAAAGTPVQISWQLIF